MKAASRLFNVLLILLSLILLISTESKTQTFDATLAITHYGLARNVAMADANQDSILDMWIILGWDGDLTIWYGNGKGSFQQGPTYPIEESESQFEVVDINNDSIPDAIISNWRSRNLEVFLGLSDGNLSPLPIQTLPSIPTGMAVLDVTLDGLPDIVYVSDSSVVVMAGIGTGYFSADSVVDLAQEGKRVTAALLNSDDLIDLVVSLTDVGRVAILLGDSANRFVTYGEAEFGFALWHTVAGDFNADGFIDLASNDLTDSAIVTLLGDGNGGFVDRRVMPVGGAPRALAAGYLDQDSASDLVVNFDNGARKRFSQVYLSNESSFIPQSDTMPLTYYPDKLLLVDFNRDSIIDIVAPNGGDNSVFLFTGKSGGSFSYTRKQHFDDCPATGSVGNFNNDEFPDIALRTGCVNPETVVLVNNGQGKFQVTSQIGEGGYGYPVVGDFTHDGIDDIILSNYSDSTIGLYESDENGLFQLSRIVDSQMDSLTSYFTTHDMNRDSYPDLIQNSYFPTMGHRVRFGGPNGEFQPVQTMGSYHVGVTYGSGDFNNDSYIDLLFYNGSNGVSISFGSDSLPHATSTPIHIGNPSPLAVGDLNEDGNLDLVICGLLSWTNGPSSYLATALGNGDGSFQTPDSTTYGEFLNRVVLFDADLDGHLDLTCSDWFKGTISFFLGFGDGLFDDPEVYFSGADVYVLPVADVNNDHSPDLIVTNLEEYSISLFYNRNSSASCCILKRGNIDCDPRNQVDIGDLIALVDELFIGFLGLCCEESANVDGTPGVDIGDLITLVDHLFITFQPLPSCK